jgi:hypothetical protein
MMPIPQGLGAGCDALDFSRSYDEHGRTKRSANARRFLWLEDDVVVRA